MQHEFYGLFLQNHRWRHNELRFAGSGSAMRYRIFMISSTSGFSEALGVKKVGCWSTQWKWLILIQTLLLVHARSNVVNRSAGFGWMVC